MNEKSKEKMTPMMRQYWEIKERYPEEVLFFRMGDFYEMFFDDALYASRVLGIALTKRQDQVPMCGVPYHALHNYVHPILEDGTKIAICEQIEDPKEAQGKIVQRDVVRVLTPGSLYEEELLSENEQRLVAASVAGGASGGAKSASAKNSPGERVYVLCDISTGDIYLQRNSASSEDEIEYGELEMRGVRELVIERSDEKGAATIPVFEREYHFGKSLDSIVARAFGAPTVEVFDLDVAERRALALMFSYLKEVSPSLKIRWKTPQKEYLRRFMILDETVVRTLELVQSQSGLKNASLLGVLDYAQSSAGKRKLSQFLTQPSLDLSEIGRRQEMTGYLLQEREIAASIAEKLKHTYDIERLLNSLQNSPQVRHLGQVSSSLKSLEEIIAIVESSSAMPAWVQESWASHHFPAALGEALDEALHMEELPPVLDERRFVKEGYHKELDELFHLAESAGQIIVEFEKSEKERLELPSLKVRYNKVIGYYLEISKGQAGKAPEEYMRRQTLVNAERFTCEKLKELEDKILGAKEKIIRHQRDLFEKLVERILQETDILRIWADRAAVLDALYSFSQAAFKNNYAAPELVEEGELIVKDLRHPVVEALFRDEVFVPNDVHLNNTDRHLAILTGPNMAGKSTFIRQVGLLQIMAQAGSFVPAASARVPVADRIFTRIGAYDRLFKGESTFYVEMAECARIFRNYTARSLILLDEVGRGTSTFDGISIARAMVESLNDPENGRPKTLFATHYGELTGLIEPGNGIIGLTVDILEEKDRIVFLRKIIEGSADKSYGIYVARLAGLSQEIVDRAGELLEELETEGIWSVEPHFQASLPPVAAKKSKAKKKGPSEDEQPSMF